MVENLGFLTVIDQCPSGLIGGFLVLNPSGRPLEFHCTVPVQPEKIQEILYGETLYPFLCGEFAKKLVLRSKLPVSYIFTNQAAILPVQENVPVPVLYVFDPVVGTPNPPLVSPTDGDTANKPEITEELNESLKSFGIDNQQSPTVPLHRNELPALPKVAGFDTSRWCEARIGSRTAAIPRTDDESLQRVLADITQLAKLVDICEPFSRIRLALDEAKNAAA